MPILQYFTKCTKLKKEERALSLCVPILLTLIWFAGVCPLPVRSLRSRFRWRKKMVVSRPEKKGCGRECISGLAFSPESCVVKKRLDAWYAGKACACSEKRGGDVRWQEHKLAPVSPDHRLLQRGDVPACALSKVPGTQRPVCGACTPTEKG